MGAEEEQVPGVTLKLGKPQRHLPQEGACEELQT